MLKECFHDLLVWINGLALQSIVRVVGLSEEAAGLKVCNGVGSFVLFIILFTQLQRFDDYFIANLPTRASITMQPHQLKLFREMFIYLNITNITDIVTASWQFITKEAYAGAKSYESIHKWPRQQHFISNAHREIWHDHKYDPLPLCHVSSIF